ncbi:MAG: flagellin hook IN motif-containing protein [Phycisphaerales bacterium]
MTGFAGTVVASRMLAPLNGVSELRPLADRRAHRGQRHSYSTPSGFQETRALLIELQAAVQAARTADDTVRRTARARAREIARILALIDRAVSQTTAREARPAPLGICAAPAAAAVTFLSTSGTYSNGGEGALTIEITGNDGTQQFTFASGTTQSSIIAAINSFTKSTGVEADQSKMNPGRVEVRTVEIGADSLIRLWTLDGPDLIFAEPIGGPPLGDLKDYGTNALVLRAAENKP